MEEGEGPSFLGVGEEACLMARLLFKTSKKPFASSNFYIVTTSSISVNPFLLLYSESSVGSSALQLGHVLC